MTCANVLVGLGKIVKGWRLAMLDGRMEVRLSASLPRRERLHHHQPVLREPCISIHAPAKGATACKRSLSLCAAAFQSTLPRRERRTSGCLIPRLYHFNPRSREGSDVALSVSAAMREISIHAPAKGATARRRMMCRCVSNFNPRSREGSDAPCSSDRQSAFLFQSTLPRRERPDRAKSYNVPLEFQSTLP